MTADTSRLAIRSAVGHANIRSLLDDLFCGGVPTVSEALLGPVNEVLDRPEVAKFRRESASSSVRSIFKTMGINANDQGFGLFVQNERRLTDLDHVRSMIGCSARRCEAKPEILQLTDFAADMAKHAVVPGKPITKAQPGNIITIVGRNFSPVPSENKVRIGGNLAPVTYASPTTLTTIVGPLDISCKKNKLTLLSGNLEVSVETHPSHTADYCCVQPFGADSRDALWLGPASDKTIPTPEASSGDQCDTRQRGDKSCFAVVGRRGKQAPSSKRSGSAPDRPPP